MALYLMSPPRPDWTVRGRANPFSQRAGAPASASVLSQQAVRDWLSVADAIVQAGGDVAVLPSSDPALTGLPYTAEAGHVGMDAAGPLFVLANLTPPHRAREPDAIAEALASWGMRTVRLGAKWEGQGDVVRIDAQRTVCTWGVGPYARSESASFAAVAPYLSRAGRVHAAQFVADPWFHGNTFLGAFSSWRGTVVFLCDAAVPGHAALRAFLQDTRTEVVSIDRALSLAYATNALQVNDTVLAPAGLPAFVHDAWRGLGLRVRELVLPALFDRGGGACVCLTNRLDGMTLHDVPPAFHYGTQRASIAGTAAQPS
jgi:N-dimethylarginine dimethylaminohydrolase